MARIINCAAVGRTILLCAVIVSALALPGSAGATDWGWQGYVGPGQGNGQCPLYSGQAACTPNWNYWFQINAANTTQGDIILAGFENNSTIRGIYLRGLESGTTYTTNHGMGGWYVRSGTTWCSWIQFECAIQGGATVWFRAYT